MHSGALSRRGSRCLAHRDSPFVRTNYGRPARVRRISTPDLANHSPERSASGAGPGHGQTLQQGPASAGSLLWTRRLTFKRIENAPGGFENGNSGAALAPLSPI